MQNKKSDEEVKKLIDKLRRDRWLTRDEFRKIIEERDESSAEYLFMNAREVREDIYCKKVFIRGLIEFTNYCKNNCIYCGIRRDNKNAERYRLTKEQILSCCKEGYKLGFRTFVLQGGEDPYYTDEIIVDIVTSIKRQHPDCAVTLSIGEKSFASYKKYYEAGADRYLLRHETANEAHYEKLHTEDQKLSNRMKCLSDLKSIGYQVGTGFMVGSPYQTIECILDDIEYIKMLNPEMVGIGPFISHKDTPFCNEADGTSELTLYLIAIFRLINPHLLIPATTALGTVDGNGREKGVLAGANVVMPNLSPINVRNKYLLYDNKICTGDESAECRRCMDMRIKSVGYEVVIERGDYQ